MFIPNENSINNDESESDSNYEEDEDELTRIVLPEGIFKKKLFQLLQRIFLISVEDTKDCMKARHILGILGFFGFANVYAMRVNLSVAIVAMVNSSQIPIENNTFDHCPLPNTPNSTKPSVSNFKEVL